MDARGPSRAERESAAAQIRPEDNRDPDMRRKSGQIRLPILRIPMRGLACE